MLYYTTNLYLQVVLEIMSIHFNALIDTLKPCSSQLFLALLHLLLPWHEYYSSSTALGLAHCSDKVSLK